MFVGLGPTPFVNIVEQRAFHSSLSGQRKIEFWKKLIVEQVNSGSLIQPAQQDQVEKDEKLRDHFMSILIQRCNFTRKEGSNQI